MLQRVAGEFAIQQRQVREDRGRETDLYTALPGQVFLLVDPAHGLDFFAALVTLYLAAPQALYGFGKNAVRVAHLNPEDRCKGIGRHLNKTVFRCLLLGVDKRSGE
ncbi:hypothetical protein D3C85_997520 [compost metagenome]